MVEVVSLDEPTPFELFTRHDPKHDEFGLDPIIKCNHHTTPREEK